MQTDNARDALDLFPRLRVAAAVLRVKTISTIVHADITNVLRVHVSRIVTRVLRGDGRRRNIRGEGALSILSVGRFPFVPSTFRSRQQSWIDQWFAKLFGTPVAHSELTELNRTEQENEVRTNSSWNEKRNFKKIIHY